jgi:hypothetical protein
MTNDNQAERGVEWSLYGLPDKPNDCPCGSDSAFVDSRNTEGARGPYFVECAECGRTGEERPSYGTALAVWNRATRNRELERIGIEKPDEAATMQGEQLYRVHVQFVLDETYTVKATSEAEAKRTAMTEGELTDSGQSLAPTTITAELVTEPSPLK